MLDQSPLRSAWNRSVGLGLGIVTLPLLAVSYVFAAIDNKSLAPIHTDYRHGQYGQATKIHKLKTMKDPDASLITSIREGGDFDNVRITPIGNLVRIFKGDELLQLWENVIFKGDENLVGPRLLSRKERQPLRRRTVWSSWFSSRWSVPRRGMIAVGHSKVKRMLLMLRKHTS